MLTLHHVFSYAIVALMICTFQPAPYRSGVADAAPIVNNRISYHNASKLLSGVILSPIPSHRHRSPLPQLQSKQAIAHGNSDETFISIRFWEHMFYSGKCVRCPIPDYNTCYAVQLKSRFGMDGVSTIIFEHMLFTDNNITLTLYEGKHCNGLWARSSGPWAKRWIKYEALMTKFTHFRS